MKGSSTTERTSPISTLTHWLEVSPMELKLTIEMQEAQGEKVDYDKENSCCLCLSEHYEGLQQMTIDEVKDLQRKILLARSEKKPKEDAVPVVKLGRCTGMHFYHKECIQSQFDSTA